MRCSQFLELYSDYRDGLIADPRLNREVHEHLRGCRRCMDYDALISRGVMALKATSEVEPSRSARRRLNARLAEPEPTDVRPASARIMVGLMIAATVALVVWTSRRPHEGAQIAVAAEVPAAATTLAPTGEAPSVDLNLPMLMPQRATTLRQLPFGQWVALSR
jgi:hypothetical protein